MTSFGKSEWILFPNYWIQSCIGRSDIVQFFLLGGGVLVSFQKHWLMPKEKDPFILPLEEIIPGSRFQLSNQNVISLEEIESFLIIETGTETS